MDEEGAVFPSNHPSRRGTCHPKHPPPCQRDANGVLRSSRMLTTSDAGRLTHFEKMFFALDPDENGVVTGRGSHI